MLYFQIQNYSFLSSIHLCTIFRHMLDLPFSGNVHKKTGWESMKMGVGFIYVIAHGKAYEVTEKQANVRGLSFVSVVIV